MLLVKLAMPPSAASGQWIRLHASNRSLQSAPRIRLCERSVSVIAMKLHIPQSSREYRHAIGYITSDNIVWVHNLLREHADMGASSQGARAGST